MKKRTAILQSKNYKTLAAAERWNIERANNEGTIMTFNGFFGVECYETPSERKYTESCMGCLKFCKLRTVGGVPMFCPSCYKRNRKEGVSLEDLRKETGYNEKAKERWGEEWQE